MDKLTAFDHEILKQFKGTDERKTLYQLSLKVSFDEQILVSRLEKLERLEYIKSHSRDGKRTYRRL